MQGLSAPWVEAVGGRLGRRGGVLQRGDSSFVGPPRRHLCSDYKLSLPENLGSCHHRYCRKEESWNFFFRGKTCSPFLQKLFQKSGNPCFSWMKLFLFYCDLFKRKQRSSSSSMWTVLGMPVTDSLMDRDLYSVLKLELVLLVSMHVNQWELKDSELQSGYREGTIMLFLTSQSMGA
ncbi:uncharacterized protein [Anas acuta]|uniref:uncharacterized protein isoform X2 n=1 Tax=Anas acuta TaxID=28680 RepID=UPI0035C8B696